MGIGAAVSVVGGAMKIGAANKQAKAAGQAADLSEEQMRQSEEAMLKGEQALDDAKGVWEEQMGMAKGFQDIMKGLGDEYGEYASQIWQDWENTFGGLEQNLSDYYTNLDPTKFSVQMKAEIGQEMNKATAQFNETAAQSGIYTSGMQLQNQKENQFKQAEAFSQADIQAPEMVNQMQQGFYGQFGAPAKADAQGLQGQAIMNQGNMANMGFNATSQANQGMANMGSQYANMYAGHANNYQQNADTYAKSAAGYGQAAGTNMGSGMNMLGSGLESLFG